MHVEEGDRTSKEINSSDRELAAFHETGHAVVGYLLGFYSVGLSIFHNEGTRGIILRRRQKQHTVQGVVDYDLTERPPDDDVSLVDLLTYLFAGIAAQKLLCAKRGVTFNPPPFSYDMHEAQNHVHNLSTRGTERVTRFSRKASDHTFVRSPRLASA
jgi:hypothetical protein